MKNRKPRSPRRAEVPRLHRGRPLRGRPARRDRDQYTQEEYEELDRNLQRTKEDYPARSTRGRKYDTEDELMDLNLDEILEVEEDEIEELEEAECPPGCVPAEEAAEEEEEEAEEAEEAAEEEEEEAVEAATEEPKVTAEETTEAAAEETTEAAPKPEIEPVETAKWAPLYTEADINRLGENTEIVLVPFFEQEDPSYVVLANSRPVGELRRSDLNLDPDHEGLFVMDSFAKGVIDGIEHLGAATILGELNLRYYADQVTERQANAAAKSAVQADMEEAFQTRMAQVKEKFFNNVMMAVTASRKNVFLKNPLRDAFRKAFRSAGIQDSLAVDLFEEAMQEAGAEYFQAMINKADEWLGFDPEALKQIEESIKEADYSHPVDRGLQVSDEIPAESYQAEAVRTMAPPPQRQAAPVSEWDAAEDAAKQVLRNASTLKRGHRR